jgi:hypothetical protein
MVRRNPTNDVARFDERGGEFVRSCFNDVIVFAANTVTPLSSSLERDPENGCYQVLGRERTHPEILDLQDTVIYTYITHDITTPTTHLTKQITNVHLKSDSTCTGKQINS